jgi:hypothetical protein
MDLRTRPAALLIALVALLAGTAGAVLASAAPAVHAAVAAEQPGHPAGSKHGLTRHAVTKLATAAASTQVARQVPGMTTAGAQSLGGEPPSAYRTTAYTVDVKDFAGSATSVDRTLPAVPAGTYQVSLSLSATMSSASASLVCSLYQDGVAQDLLTAYGSTLSTWRTVAATRTVTVAGPLHLQCQGRLANLNISPITAIPANPSYAPAQLTFVRVDAATSLGTAQ